MSLSSSFLSSRNGCGPASRKQHSTLLHSGIQYPETELAFESLNKPTAIGHQHRAGRQAGSDATLSRIEWSRVELELSSSPHRVRVLSARRGAALFGAARCGAARRREVGAEQSTRLSLRWATFTRGSSRSGFSEVKHCIRDETCVCLQAAVWPQGTEAASSRWLPSIRFILISEHIEREREERRYLMSSEADATGNEKRRRNERRDATRKQHSPEPAPLLMATTAAASGERVKGPRARVQYGNSVIIGAARVVSATQCSNEAQSRPRWPRKRSASSRVES